MMPNHHHMIMSIIEVSQLNLIKLITIHIYTHIPRPFSPPPTLYARRPLLKSGLTLSTPLLAILIVHNTASSSSVDDLHTSCHSLLISHHLYHTRRFEFLFFQEDTKLTFPCQVPPPRLDFIWKSFGQLLFLMARMGTETHHPVRVHGLHYWITATPIIITS